MAHNVVHMARILKANPIPPEGNTVPMPMMAPMASMAPGQEKRMMPVLMEEMDRDASEGSVARRWWKAIRGGS